MNVLLIHNYENMQIFEYTVCTALLGKFIQKYYYIMQIF
jgi:hypothetical protein